MSRDQSLRLGITAIVVGWCFDLLFWGKAPGISFFIYVALCLGAGVFLTWKEKTSFKTASLALFAPALFFAWMTFVRLEHFTRFVD